MYLYNKNILEYAEIMVTDGNSRILNIESHSKILYRVVIHKSCGQKEREEGSRIVHATPHGEGTRN